MAHWIRFAHSGKTGFGQLRDGNIAIHTGDMFESPTASGESLPVTAVTLLTPTQPTKMVALWNNFHELAAKLGQPEPSEPLYLIKPPSSFLATGQIIRAPKAYSGKVVYEGELGIVIGRLCRDVAETDADRHIFGYTCINDVTAAELINKDPTFAQWTRAKSFDSFGVFGPAVATGIDPSTLTVKTILNGKERQSYPVSDMIFPPRRLVSLISRDLTLLPGDVIACGTSVGVGSMKPGSRVEIVIDPIGSLSNEFQ